MSLEDVGEDALVMVPGSSEVIRLQGETADLVRQISSAKSAELGNSEAVTQLIKLGVLSRQGISRRGLVKAGAIGAGAGVAVLAMPVAAVASSEPPLQFEGDWTADGTYVYFSLFFSNFFLPGTPSELTWGQSDSTAPLNPPGYEAEAGGPGSPAIYWRSDGIDAPPPPGNVSGTFLWDNGNQTIFVTFIDRNPYGE